MKELMDIKNKNPEINVEDNGKKFTKITAFSISVLDNAEKIVKERFDLRKIVLSGLPSTG